MCEGYYDRKAQRWRMLEAIEDEELEALLAAPVNLPPAEPAPRKRPGVLAR